MPIKGRSDAELNEQIRNKLSEDHAIDATHWKSIPKMHTLYNLAHRRKRNGLHFMGHGSWYNYLEKELGASSISPMHVPLSRITYEVRKWLGKRKTKPQPSLPIAVVRHLLYGKKVNGVSYLGHGSWKGYLKKEHGVKFGRQPFEFSDAELHKEIKSELAKISWQTSTGTWQARPRLRKLYKEVVKKKFFGCAGWHDYLATFVKKGLKIPFVGRNKNYRLKNGRLVK